MAFPLTHLSTASVPGPQPELASRPCLQASFLEAALPSRQAPSENLLEEISYSSGFVYSTAKY